MGFDIRLPIGIMFTLLGAVLVAYGLMTEPALYERSLGINVNLRWGCVVLLFGALMLACAFAFRGAPAPQREHDDSRADDL